MEAAHVSSFHSQSLCMQPHGTAASYAGTCDASRCDAMCIVKASTGCVLHVRYGWPMRGGVQPAHAHLHHGWGLACAGGLGTYILNGRAPWSQQGPGRLHLRLPLGSRYLVATTHHQPAGPTADGQPPPTTVQHSHTPPTFARLGRSGALTCGACAVLVCLYRLPGNWCGSAIDVPVFHTSCTQHCPCSCDAAESVAASFDASCIVSCCDCMMDFSR
jgi:hypothetical protein